MGWQHSDWWKGSIALIFVFIDWGNGATIGKALVFREVVWLFQDSFWGLSRDMDAYSGPGY